MEISSIEGNPFWDEPVRSEPPTSELITKVALLVSTLLAAGAFAPVLFKKRRVYSLPAAPAPQETAPPPPLAITTDAVAPDLLPRCNRNEQKLVADIFNAIADWSYWDLMRNQAELQAKGERINHLHPFTLCMAIPKKAMQTIFASHWNLFKINKVMEGIERGLVEDGDSLFSHVPSFAEAMKKSPERITLLIQNQRWRELVDYLFDIG